MAHISVETATLEIEPYDSLVYSQASPFSFSVDQHTIGYLTSRYIVLHCIPLAEERYLAVGAGVQVIQCQASDNGEFLALLETQLDRVQLTIYSISQFKKISTIILHEKLDNADYIPEIPQSFHFAAQNKYVIIYYFTPQKIRTVLLAWQRSQVDDVYELTNEVFSMQLNKFSLRQLITSNQNNQVVFYRQTDTGLQQYAAVNQPQNYQLGSTARLVGQLFISSQTVVNIVSNGEIVVYNPPHCVGLIALTQDRSIELDYSSNISQPTTIKGDVVVAATYNNKLVIGTDCGELVLIDLTESANFVALSGPSNTSVANHTNQVLGGAVGIPCRVFGNSEMPMFPCKIVAKSYVASKCSIKALNLNDYYCLVESTDSDLYVWNITGDVFTLINGALVVQAKDIQPSSSQSIGQQTVQFKPLCFQSPELEKVYEKIIPHSLEDRAYGILSTSIVEEKDNVAAMSMLMSLQNFCEYIGESQYFNQKERNELAQFVQGSEMMSQLHKVNTTNTLSCSPFPQYLNMTTSPIIWSDIIQGYPALNQPVAALKQYGDNIKASLQQHSLIPAGYRMGKPIGVRCISYISISPQSEILVISSGQQIYAGRLLVGGQLSITAEINTKQNVRQLLMCPGGTSFYAVFDDGIGEYLVCEGHIQQINFQVLSGLSIAALSHGGGYLAVCRDQGMASEIDVFSTSGQFAQPVLVLRCHNAEIGHLEFLSGDQVLVSVSKDGMLYGHIVSSGKRVYESVMKGVRLDPVMLVSNWEVERGVLDGEPEQVGMAQQHDIRNNGDFAVCGADRNGFFYEVANGRQQHQIKLSMDEGEHITCFVKVPKPPQIWGGGYLKTVLHNNQNVRQHQKSGLDGSNATTNLFGKENGEFLDRAAYHQRNNEAMTDRLVKEQCEAVYEQQTNYLQPWHGYSGNGIEEFSERPIKFLLAFTSCGYCDCYEWPLRNSDRIFRVRLHDGAITAAYLVRGSILVTVSQEQMLLSNIRCLIPAQAIFGSTVRNKCLNKLKALFDGNNMSLLVRLPVTRVMPAFHCRFATTYAQQTTQTDQLIHKLVFNMSEIYQYTDFRVSMLREALRQKQKEYDEVVAQVRQNQAELTDTIDAETKKTTEELERCQREFKEQHQRIYQAVQGKFSLVMDELKQQIRTQTDQLERLSTGHEQIVAQLQAERTQRLQALDSQRTMLVQEKQLQIDRLDEQLAGFEAAFAEEKRQVEQEREEAVRILQQIGRENRQHVEEVESALRGYNALQRRRNQNLQAQIAQIDAELSRQRSLGDAAANQISVIDEQNAEIMQKIRSTDQQLLNLENQIQQHKQEIAGMNKTQFVLAHHINELKQEIRPRDELIADMRNRQADLQVQLEDGQSQWTHIKQITQATKRDMERLSREAAQANQLLQLRQRQLDSIKKDFENFMSENNQEQYCSCMFQLYQRYDGLLQEISTKQMIGTNKKEDRQLINELDQHKGYLHNKLDQLYNQLYAEDRKFAQVQTNSLDENSALLQESHRLKEENIQLSAQLSKIMAILQALKIKDLTASLKQKGLYRAQSIAEQRKQALQDKYNTLDFNAIDSKTENQSVIIKNLLNNIDLRRAQSQQQSSSKRSRSRHK